MLALQAAWVRFPPSAKAKSALFSLNKVALCRYLDVTENRVTDSLKTLDDNDLFAALASSADGVHDVDAATSL